MVVKFIFVLVDHFCDYHLSAAQTDFGALVFPGFVRRLGQALMKELLKFFHECFVQQEVFYELFLAYSDSGIIEALVIAFFVEILTFQVVRVPPRHIFAEDFGKLNFNFLLLAELFLQLGQHNYASCPLAVLQDLVWQVVYRFLIYLGFVFGMIFQHLSLGAGSEAPKGDCDRLGVRLMFQALQWLQVLSGAYYCISEFHKQCFDYREDRFSLKFQLKASRDFNQ